MCNREQVYGKNQTRDPNSSAPAPIVPAPGSTAGREQFADPIRPDLPLERVLGLVTDAFTGATERHIEVGDGLELFVVEKDKGVRIISLPLKRD